MSDPWKESIYLHREQLAQTLHEPLARLAERCVPVWGDRDGMNAVLAAGLATIPHCTYLYCLDERAGQISDNLDRDGIVPGHFGRDRSGRPYMREAMPSWGFLLSDAYLSLRKRRPSLTALQVVTSEGRHLGYVGADFDLRDLPVTADLYREPQGWRQVKGDPAIRGNLFAQSRVESPMDSTLDQALAILAELLTDRGVFQCQIHFSSSQAIIWTLDDPFRYRILTQEALSDPDICLIYPIVPYPEQAAIPADAVGRILERLRDLRLVDENIYLRQSSINLFNGMVSLTFSCDGSHYMPHTQFLNADTGFWFGGVG